MIFKMWLYLVNVNEMGKMKPTRANGGLAFILKST